MSLFRFFSGNRLLSSGDGGGWGVAIFHILVLILYVHLETAANCIDLLPS